MKSQASYGSSELISKLMAQEMSNLMFDHVKPMLSEEQLKSWVKDNIDD
jgi:hypothetical protein